MKNLLIFLSLIIPLSAYSQTAGEFPGRPDRLQRKGADIVADGIRLTDAERNILLSDIGGTDYCTQWDKAAKGFRTGKGLLIAGGATTFVGALCGTFCIVYMFADVVGQSLATVMTLGTYKPGGVCRTAVIGSYVSFGAVVAGIGCLAAGATVYCVSKSKMNKIVNGYNDRVPELTFGLQKNGIGIALNF